MPLPTAVASSVKTPGFWLTVNLLAATANPGLAGLKALMIAQKGSAGNITPDTEVRQCFGADEVLTALGEGQPGHLASIAMFKKFGLLSLWVVAPTAAAGAAAAITHVISGTPTDENQFDFDVAGRQTGVVSWAAGESIGTFRTRAIGAIQNVRPLPITPTAGGGAGDLVLTAKSGGTWGNDITCGVKKIKGTGGVVTPGGANLTGGATEFNITTVLGTIGTTEYNLIGLATSNTDATDASATANPERLMTHLETKSSGLDALLQYGFVGHTGSIANVKGGAIGRNSVRLQYCYAKNAQSLPAEIMGDELGDTMRWVLFRSNYNRIGNRSQTLIGAKDPVANKLSALEKEDLLSNGVTPFDFVPNGTELALVRPITTHSQDSAAAPDYRCFDAPDVHGVDDVARDLRTTIPVEFANASITEDLPPGADPLPPGVVERKNVQQFVVGRLRTKAGQGIVDTNRLDAALANNELQVQIDGVDKTQVNIFIPLSIIKPLAKFSTVIHKVA